MNILFREAFILFGSRKRLSPKRLYHRDWREHALIPLSLCLLPSLSSVSDSHAAAIEPELSSIEASRRRPILGNDSSRTSGMAGDSGGTSFSGLVTPPAQAAKRDRKPSAGGYTVRAAEALPAASWQHQRRRAGFKGLAAAAGVAGGATG